MVELILVTGGIAAGAAVAWLFARVHFTAVAVRERAAGDSRIAVHETLEKELGKQLTERQLEIGGLRTALETERVQRAQAETRSQATRESVEAERRALEEARERLGDAFKALSADALRQNNSQFLELAKQALDAQLGPRDAAMAGLFTPLQEALRRSEEHVRELESKREHAYGSLENRLQELGRETSNLVAALRGSQTRGRWGEIALRRIVEMAGMTKHCDFEEQVTVDGEAGRLRPDMVVTLPDGRKIVLDSKVPLTAYLDAVDAPTPEQRQKAFTRHAEHLRSHMLQLAGRAYWRQVAQSPDLVVMFIPGESFVAAAWETDPNLLTDALEKRVVVATPVTLFALLAAIAYGWRQQQAAESAADITRLGQEVYERLAKLGEHFGKVGASLGNAVDAYNAAIGSLEGRLLPTARKFRDLGAGTGEEIPTLELIDHDPRRLTASEFAVQLQLGPTPADAGTGDADASTPTKRRPTRTPPPKD